MIHLENMPILDLNKKWNVIRRRYKEIGLRYLVMIIINYQNPVCKKMFSAFWPFHKIAVRKKAWPPVTNCIIFVKSSKHLYKGIIINHHKSKDQLLEFLLCVSKNRKGWYSATHPHPICLRVETLKFSFKRKSCIDTSSSFAQRCVMWCAWNSRNPKQKTTLALWKKKKIATRAFPYY